MLESGKLCSECIGGKCRDAPTTALPTSIQCTECAGLGCMHCQGGDYDLTTCPDKYCGSMLELSYYVGMTEHGLLPESGGLLDQTNWFIEANRYLTSQRNGIKTSEITNSVR